MRSLKTFCASSLLLLVMSIPTFAGDMECGIFTPPPPPVTTQSQQTTLDADQNSIEGEDGGLLDSMLDWLLNLVP